MSGSGPTGIVGRGGRPHGGQKFVVLARAWAAIKLGFAAAPGIAIVSLLIAVLDGTIAPASAWAMKLLLDVLGGTDPDGWRAAVIIAALAGLGLLSGTLQGVRGYTSAVLGRAVRLAVVDSLFARVNAIPGLSRFEDPLFRDRLRLAEESGDHAPGQITATLLQVVGNVVQVGGFAAVLLNVWPPMMALALGAAIPAAFLHLRLAGQRAGLAARLTSNVRRQFFYRTLLIEPKAAKEVRLFGIGDFLHGRLIRDFRAANAAENALDRRALRVQVTLELIGASVAALGTAVAGWQVLAGRIGLGDLTAFIAAIGGVRAAAVGATVAVAQGYQAVALFAAYHEIVIDPLAETTVHPARATVTPLTRGVELRDVWFRYRPDAPWVLRGVSFTIGTGETVGLVGLNGAGKSTVVKLLCRMYEPQRGAIYWDGVDIAELDPVGLRQRIAAVFQDYVEYDLTAAENIAVGNLLLRNDIEAIRTAAQGAGIDEELTCLPNGYDTMLSRLFLPDDDPAGSVAMLSGGQWQRVAVARGFLRADADLLVMDEPSAGLDAEAEHDLHSRLARMRSGRASLLISHRLSALREADRIVVLAGGRVTENGPHARLLACGGDYARLFNLQAAGYRAEEQDRTVPA